MSKVVIDTKSNEITINFPASDTTLAKLLLCFLDPKAVVGKNITKSFLAKLSSLRVNEIKLDLNHASVSKEALLAILDSDIKIK